MRLNVYFLMLSLLLPLVTACGIDESRNDNKNDEDVIKTQEQKDKRVLREARRKADNAESPIVKTPIHSSYSYQAKLLIQPQQQSHLREVIHLMQPSMKEKVIANMLI